MSNKDKDLEEKDESRKIIINICLDIAVVLVVFVILGYFLIEMS